MTSSIGLFLQSAANSFGSVQGSWNSSVGATDSLMSAMSASVVNEAKGKSAIANGQALTRTNNQISQIIQNILNGTTGNSGTSSSSSTGNYKPAKAATGTGNKAVSVTTPLSTIGILHGGSVYISAGGNTTTYTSTGSDTVGDLLAAINLNQPDSAQVKASLNSRGDIVLTSKNTKDQINVSGVYAGNIGFAVNNRTFKPTASSGTPPSATTTSSTSKTTAKAKPDTSLQSTLASNNSSAASFLAASGASGSLVNLLT